MSRYVYIVAFVLALVVLALGGWTVKGLRRLRPGRPRRRPAGLAPSF